jgi:phosphoglucomutase
MDEAYIKMVKSLSIYPEIIAKQHDLKIVYTPIHGTGITLVPKVLAAFGFDNVTIVEEQATPDGNFPTVAYPNPEEKETMSLGLKKAREINADILLGTDPDADRVGIGVKNDKGEWVLLNGNQTAVLAFNYMIEARKEKGIIQPNDMVIKTIVTTDMIDEIAKQSHIHCYNVLTGFKWIAELIKEKEKTENYVIGGEESYGLMIGDKLRDKDAVSAVAILCEMSAYEKNKGKSLYDKLIDLYLQFGFYKESLISITKKGMDGQKQIADMMASYRNHPPSTIGGSSVVHLLDYQISTGKNLKSGETWKIVLPVSNVLQFILEDGSKISARPSGTEPKIKFYFSVHEKQAAVPLLISLMICFKKNRNNYLRYEIEIIFRIYRQYENNLPCFGNFSGCPFRLCSGQDAGYFRRSYGYSAQASGSCLGMVISKRKYNRHI